MKRAFLILLALPALGAAQTMPRTQLPDLAMHSIIMIAERTDFKLEIRMTAAQEKKVHECQDRITKWLAGNQRRMDFHAYLKQVNAEGEKFWAVLKPSQKRRLLQIRLQGMGPHALRESAAQRSLKMTPAQISKVSKLQVSANKAVLNIKTKDEKAMMKQIAVLGRQFAKDAFAVLTKPQRATWSNLVGRIFPKARPNPSPIF